MVMIKHLIHATMLTLVFISADASGQPANQDEKYVKLSPSELLHQVTFQVQPKFDCDEEISRFYFGEKLELFIRVNGSGVVENVTSLNGPTFWKDNAIAALKQWRFKPLGRKPESPFAGKIVLEHPKECKGYSINSIEHYRLQVRADSWQSYFRLGRRLLVEHSYNGAIDAFEKALAINPNVGIAWFHLGEAYHWVRRYENAADCYRKAIEVNPGFVEAYFALAIRYEADGKSDLAVDTYKTILELRPDLDVKLWIYDEEARIFERLSRLDAQIDATEKYYAAMFEARNIGSRADSGSPAYSLGKLGDLYIRKGQREKGIELFFEAFRLVPGGMFGFDGLLKQAALYKAQGEEQKSIDLFARIMESTNTNLKANLSSRHRADLLVAKGRLYSEQGKYRQAISNYFAASLLQMDNIQIHEYLRDTHLKLGDTLAANVETLIIKRIKKRNDRWN